MTTEPEKKRSNVVRLPDRQPVRRAGDAVERAGDVLEGDVLTAAQYDEIQRQKRDARYAEYKRTAVTVVQVTRTAVTHDRTKTTARAAVRHGAYVLGGVGIVAKRVWEAKTNSRYERILNTLEVKQDWEKLELWECRAEQAKQRRHDRRIEWFKASGKILGAIGIWFGAAVVALILLGGIIALASHNGSMVFAPLMGVLEVIRFTYWLVVSWGLLMATSAAGLGLYLLWRVGKAAEKAPTWALSPNHRIPGEGEPVTPDRVINALCHLGISDLRKAVKALPSGGAELLSSIAVAGCGVEVDVRLPQCSTDTSDIQKRRRKLAELLDRHEHELFITIPKAARTVRLWVADPGALDEPIEASPLVVSPPKQVSMYRDRAPWGQNLRGDAVSVNLWQKHLLITGMSNMGKTVALRSLALWLALDPTVEFHIADLKGLGDWRMFRGLAKTYIEGPTDDHVIAATEMLEAGVREMERRLTSFDADKYPDGVPPGLPGYHPIVMIVDEAQVAYMCPAVDEEKNPYGGKSNRSRFLSATRRLNNQGRAVNALDWQGTQDPTDQNLPKMARESFHIRAGLRVGTSEQSRMALGDAAVNDGAAPHELQAEHKGTVVVTGPGINCQQGQSSEIVRTHYINGTEGTAIAEHAKQLRSGRPAHEDEPEERDLLTDVLEVLDGEDETAPQVARRLRDLADVYEGLTGEALAALLRDEFNVPVRMKDGSPMVRVKEVQGGIARRENHPDQG